MYQQRVGISDKVMKTCKDLYVHGATAKREFATSVRDLRENMSSQVGDFTAYLMHEIRIPLEQFQLTDEKRVNNFK